MSTTCHFGANVAGRPMKTRGRSKGPGRSMKGPTNGEIRASDGRCPMRIPRPVRRRKGVLTSDPGTTRGRYTAAKHQIGHRAWRGVVSARGRATEWATGRATERTSEDRRSRRRRKEQGDIWNRNTAYPSGKQATSPSPRNRRERFIVVFSPNLSEASCNQTSLKASIMLLVINPSTRNNRLVLWTRNQNPGFVLYKRIILSFLCSTP